MSIPIKSIPKIPTGMPKKPPVVEKPVVQDLDKPAPVKGSIENPIKDTELPKEIQKPKVPVVARASILSRAQPVSAVNRDNLCIMINGTYGSGKTTIASTGPNDILFLDVKEGGTKSIFNKPHIDVIDIGSWADVDPTNPESVYWALKTGGHGYKTVVFDTLTQLQNLAMEEVLKGTDKTTNDKMWQEWGTVNKMMTNMVLAYKELPMVKFFLCQERLNNNEGKAAEQLNPVYGPALTPGAALGINPAMDVIGHILIDEKTVIIDKKPQSVIQHKLLMKEQRNFLAKTRKPLEFETPRYVIDATYNDIKAVVDGTYKVPVEA